jgi:hypothetical protein
MPRPVVPASPSMNTLPAFRTAEAVSAWVLSLVIMLMAIQRSETKGVREDAKKAAQRRGSRGFSSGGPHRDRAGKAISRRRRMTK